MKNYVLEHGDCLEVLRTMGSDSVDAIITDPPYGLNIQYDQWKDTETNLQALIDGFMPEARRVARSVVVFPGINNIWKYPKADWVACWFYGTTGSWGKLGYNSWQPLLFYGRNTKRYGMDTIKYSRMEKRIQGHPCSKPVGLMRLVVERFTEQQQTVLDPFVGTGTTGVACIQTGRKFHGVDMSLAYLDIARARIKAAAEEAAKPQQKNISF